MPFKVVRPGKGIDIRESATPGKPGRKKREGASREARPYGIAAIGSISAIILGVIGLVIYLEGQKEPSEVPLCGTGRIERIIYVGSDTKFSEGSETRIIAGSEYIVYSGFDGYWVVEPELRAPGLPTQIIFDPENAEVVFDIPGTINDPTFNLSDNNKYQKGQHTHQLIHTENNKRSIETFFMDLDKRDGTNELKVVHTCTVERR